VLLSITVSGTYFSIIDYLDRIDSLPRLVVVDSVTFAPGEGTDQVSLSLSARMFTTAAGVAGTTTPPTPTGSQVTASSTTTTAPQVAAGGTGG
jgi:hypothetical protein